MPVLKNGKHEAVAQAYIADPERIGYKAYLQIYPRVKKRAAEANWSRLLNNAAFKARIDELQAEAAKPALEKAGVTIERVVMELAKIAFSDIRDVMEFHGSLIQEQDNPDGGDVLVIKNIFSNHVRVRSSNEISDEAAAAISEIRQTKDGLSIKLHSKQAACETLLKTMGALDGGKDKGDDAADAANRSAEELAKATLSLIERVGRMKAAAKSHKSPGASQAETQH